MNVNVQLQALASKYIEDYQYIAQSFPGDAPRYNVLVTILKELIRRTVEAEGNDQTIIR